MVKSSMLESVRAVTGGAAPFGPALIENFKKKCEPHEVEFREGKINSISIQGLYHQVSHIYKSK